MKSWFVLAAAALTPACGASDVPAPENQSADPGREIPLSLASAHAEVMTARHALASCRAPRERQAIDAADRRRAELEMAIGRRLGADALARLRAGSQRAALVVQVQLCPGESGLSQLARAEGQLAAAAANAGAR